MMKRKNKKLIKILIYLILFSQTLFAGNEKIELFWRILIKDYHFGYTIFGNKPMSFDRYYLDNSSYNPLVNADPMLRSLWKFWEENYVSPQKNFCINRVQYIEENIPYEEFYIINKEKCLNIIKEHSSNFKVYFANTLSPDEILEKICDQGPHIIKNHQLLGLLLGFGKNNTRKFQQRHDYFNQLTAYIWLQSRERISKLENYDHIDIFYLYKHSIFKPQENWDDIFKKYKHLDSRLVPLNSTISYSKFLAIPLPCFVVDKADKETIILLRNYLNTGVKIKGVYYDNNFLDLILEKLDLKTPG